jgi:hypothetical protein
MGENYHNILVHDYFVNIIALALFFFFWRTRVEKLNFTNFLNTCDVQDIMPGAVEHAKRLRT